MDAQAFQNKGALRVHPEKSVKTPEEKLAEACSNNSEQEFLAVFKQHPTLNVNSRVVVVDQNNFTEQTPLGIVCRMGYTGLACRLLTHPSINVNVSEYNDKTPFFLACEFGRSELVSVMLRDSRIGINMLSTGQYSPFSVACYNGHLNVVERFLASRRKLTTETLAKGLVLSDRLVHTPTSNLIRAFQRDPIKRQHLLRLQLGIYVEFSSEVYALIVFYCDDFFTLKDDRFVKKPEEKQSKRFISIVGRLPMEMQMIICKRAYSLTGNNIRGLEFEESMRRIRRLLVKI